MKRAKLPFLPEFFDRYILLVPEEDELIEALEKSAKLVDVFEKVLVENPDFRYEEGKWSAKEVIQHIVDNERIQAGRAFAISVEGNVSLSGYDENQYVQNSNAENKSIHDLLEEFKMLRGSNICMFKGFSEEMLLKEGSCWNIKMNPAALGFQMVGHQIHHFNTLRERYFPDMTRKKKRPDNVVFDTDKGEYTAGLMKYSTNLGAPAITTEDITTWKKVGANKVNHLIKAKFERLRKNYEDMVTLYEWNEIIYNSEFSFEPIVGNMYHLYRRENGEFFLSQIPPEEWGQDFMGSFEYDFDKFFSKVD